MGAANFNFFNIVWEAGIVVKLILLFFVIASIFSWAVILKKRKSLREMRDNNERFMNIYRGATSLRSVIQQTSDFPFSPFCLMFTEGYNELSRIRSTYEKAEAPQGNLVSHFHTFGLGLIERALKRGAIEANSKLDETISILATLGSLSPFIGLFGTVWGIIDAFTGLAKGSGASIEAVAPGIAEALVTTAIGIFVAIPAVWFYNYFSNEISKMNAEMESFGQDFLNVVERSLISGK